MDSEEEISDANDATVCLIRLTAVFRVVLWQFQSSTTRLYHFLPRRLEVVAIGTDRHSTRSSSAEICARSVCTHSLIL